jgi:hypothetical protein
VEKANEQSQVEAIKEYGTYTDFRRVLEWSKEESGRGAPVPTSASAPSDAQGKSYF